MQEQETTVTLQEDVDTPFVRGKRATRAEKLGEPRRRKKKRLDGQASAAEPEAAVPGQKEYEDVCTTSMVSVFLGSRSRFLQPSAYTLEKDPRFLDAASSKPKLRQMVATRLEAGSIDTGFQKQLRQQHDMVRELMAKRAQNAKAQGDLDTVGHLHQG